MRGETPEQGLLDQRLVKALGHPLRQRILFELREDAASPSQISARLEEPLGKVSYHVKILDQCGAVELIRTEPVRGAREHFYRATAIPRLDEQEWLALHPSTRRALFDATLRQIWEHVAAAEESGGFEDPRTSVHWTWLELDDQAQAELLAEIEALNDRALALQAQAADRLRGRAAESRKHLTELVLMHFHRNGGAA